MNPFVLIDPIVDDTDYHKIKQDLIESLKPSEDDKGRTCEECGETFSFVKKLVEHLRREHGIERPFKCLLCDKDYPQRFMLNAHMRKSHESVSLAACAHCDFLTADRGKLERHIRRYHSHELVGLTPTTPSVSSKILIEQQKQQQQLDQQRLTEFLREFECITQGEEAPVRRRRGRPRGRKVPINRTFLCADCGKELKTIKGLQIHTRLHTGEKPFACKTCDKRFSCETLLRTHTVTHTGARNYVCDVCQKAFTQRSTLVVHKRYHSGERPFVCQLCARGFVTRFLLKNHLRICDPNAPYRY